MKNSITNKLVFSILIVSSLATFFFTALNFYRDYKSEISSLKTTMGNVIISYRSSLSRALFSYDEDQLKTQLNGILAMPHVAKLEVRDIGNEVLYSLSKAPEDFSSQPSNWIEQFLPDSYQTTVVELSHPFEGNEIRLGSLVYISSSKQVYATLASRAFYFLLSQGIKTLAISIIFLVIAHILITKHLIKITNYVSRINPSQLRGAGSLYLDRLTKTKDQDKDELEILVDKVNEVTEALTERNVENAKLLDQAQDQVEVHKQHAMTAAKLASIGELAGGIAHEINNPISIIAGYTAMLEHLEGKNDEERKTLDKISQQIEETIKRVSAITSSMLKYSRRDTKLQLIDLKVVLNEVIVIALSKIKSSGAKITITADKSVVDGYYIHGNKVQVGQIVINLINNAIDAMEENEIPINDREINLNLSQSNNFVVLNVINPGPPIPEEIKDKILQPFFTTKPEGKGTGLGLSICTTIMDAHNGSFKLIDTDEGADFEIKFPKPGAKS